MVPIRCAVLGLFGDGDEVEGEPLGKPLWKWKTLR